MYDITLVCTHHSEFGKCNSDELYKIIESIRPEVIFEELTQDLFDRIYKENNIPSVQPEIKAVQRYLRDHDITHIPVDITVSQTASSAEREYMLHVLKNLYPTYSRLEEEQKNLIYKEGYDYINSKKHEELTEKMKLIEKSFIAVQPNHQLYQIHKLFYEEQHAREDKMIKNIDNYSGRNAYNQALLLLGSWHRKTIIEKIKKYEFKNNVKLNWALYGD